MSSNAPYIMKGLKQRMIQRLLRFIIFAGILLLPISEVSAQDETPTPEASWLIQGSLVNQTTGKPGPQDVELMLHSYDEAGNPLGMIHGISGPGGAFEFEAVQAEQSTFYLVMAVYQGATSMSDAVSVTDGVIPFVTVPIYETTTETKNLQIEQLHFLLGIGKGGLTVIEFYALSNLGDRTIVGAAPTGEGVVGGLQFTLPEDAANVSFPSASHGRYELFPGGFFDTASVPPGVGTRQVVVSYIVPFDESRGMERTLPFNANQVSILVPQQSGLQIEVNQPSEQTSERLGPNAEAFNVTSLDSQSEGATLHIEVTGDPTVTSQFQDQSNVNLDEGASQWVLIGASVLGIALILGGIWVLRRTRELPEEDQAQFEENELV